MDRHNEHFKRLRRLILLFFVPIVALTISIFGLIFYPQHFTFDDTPIETEEVLYTEVDDDDAIVNGIHVRTGLKDAPGLMTVVQNCTNCHSAQLVIQNKMNRDRWEKTIDWMQETQNLWDLGKNEKVIIDYLVTNYPIIKKGRRQNLKDIEWYTLKN